MKLLNTRAFTSWKQRPYIFHFRNTRPITGTAPHMYQNMTISPLSATDGTVNMVCLMVYDVTAVASSQRDLEQANEQLTQLSETNQLTSLLNRGTWENLLATEYKRFCRYGHNAALVMFDIDHFKAVNDTHGHMAGDDVIRHTSRTLLKNLRQADLAGRYGGEEFAVILPETRVEGAVRFCERIRQAIEQATVKTGESAIRYTVSMGVAAASKKVPEYRAWLEQADRALYATKQNGRNQVRVYAEADENI